MPRTDGSAPEARGGDRVPASAPAEETRVVHYLGRSLLQAGPVLFAGTVIALIVTAYLNRAEGYLSAETGLGYWLGIAGAITMLMLVAYPLRKRYRSLHRLGRVANWFRLHMVLGIAGPTLVILHTNFNLGSLNSQLALFTMLTVVASGIVGRYLYAKVHKGLYGQHAELREIMADIQMLRSALGHQTAGHPFLTSEMERYAARLTKSHGVAAGAVSAVLSGPRTYRSRKRMLRMLRQAMSASPAWSAQPRKRRCAFVADFDQRLRIFFAAVRKAERLAVFERLFSLWHHLHVPLFAVLTLTVLIHIIAVHRY